METNLSNLNNSNDNEQTHSDRNQIITEDELRKDQIEEPKENIIFSHQDHILVTTIKNFGPCDSAFDSLAKTFDKTIEEVKERYEFIVKSESIAKEGDDGYTKNNAGVKDSYGTSICRRCYKFNCHIHRSTDDGLLHDNQNESMDNKSMLAPDLERPLATQMKSIKGTTFRSLSDLERYYTPCKCQVSCESQCPCFHKGGCEKFCGCPRSCNHRNKGCECYNNSCATNQCPCFVAKRECDPDICKYCKLGCGDGSLGYLIVDNGGRTCKNMKIFLRQKKKLLLGQSDISGWAVFLKDNVGKDQFIGEYTGELIDTLTDKLYMCRLDGKFMINSRRKGNLLKYVKHSQNPNCYTKIVKVIGDYRVGVYSTRDIQAGEELLIDYNCPLHLGPYWPKEQDDNKLKNEDGASSSYNSTMEEGLSSVHEKNNI